MAKKQIRGYRDCSATIRIFGKIPELGTITRRLGIRPVHIHRRGQRGVYRVGKRTIQTSTLFPHDSWQLTARVPSKRALKHHMQWLCDRLGKKAKDLRCLARKYDVDLYCSYHSNYDRGNLEFPPEVLKWCGELGIPLRVSILVQD